MGSQAVAPADGAPHLLVVDDDRRIRDLLLRFLQREGFRVSTAESAAEARAKLSGLSFDLLILDVMMPGETGFEFAKAIRSASLMPILMLTARDESESRIKGLEIGADDYLAKPFETRELVLRINNILRRQLASQTPAIEAVKFGDFVFHIGRGELRRGGARGGYLGPPRPMAQKLDAEGALCALTAHHCDPDGDPAIGRRFCVYGATLEHGDPAAFGGGDPRHRDAH